MKTAAAILTAGVSGLAITAILGLVFVPWLRRLKFGRTVLEAREEKLTGKDAPTMGGIFLIFGTCGAIITTVLTDKIMGGDIIASGSVIPSEMYTKLLSGILTAIALGFIGFVDDYARSVKGMNLGMTVREKTVLQLVTCVAYLTSLFMSMQGEPYMFIPFVGTVSMGFFYWIFGIVYIFSAVNAVNYTDGIDGLCGGLTLTTALAIGVAAALKGLFGFSMASAALVGACLGFLVWNRHPAKVRMGEGGSMFLGGMVVALAYAIGCPLILLPAGIVFFIEGGSKVLQVLYYKTSGGKKLLKSAPLHRHLEMNGMSERKIALILIAVNILGGVAAVAVLYCGGYILR